MSKFQRKIIKISSFIKLLIFIEKFYSINILFIPFPGCNISTRKNSPLNSIDLLNLENFESTTAV